jgi:hypothetical protein
VSARLLNATRRFCHFSVCLKNGGRINFANHSNEDD